MSAPKRPRLTELGRDSHVTANALTKLLHILKDRGLPDAFSQSTNRRQRQQEVYRTTPFGPIIQTVSLTTSRGKPFVLHVQHPFAMLTAAMEQSEPFNEHIRSMLDREGNRMNIAFYSDEITPGYVLAHENDRKLQVLRWIGRQPSPSNSRSVSFNVFSYVIRTASHIYKYIYMIRSCSCAPARES